MLVSAIGMIVDGVGMALDGGCSAITVDSLFCSLVYHVTLYNLGTYLTRAFYQSQSTTALIFTVIAVFF
jgi:hypothetical protein